MSYRYYYYLESPNGEGLIFHVFHLRFLINSLNRRIKIGILICCLYSFPTEVVGRR